jgi:hypothetical protein
MNFSKQSERFTPSIATAARVSEQISASIGKVNRHEDATGFSERHFPAAIGR